MICQLYEISLALAITIFSGISHIFMRLLVSILMLVVVLALYSIAMPTLCLIAIVVLTTEFGKRDLTWVDFMATLVLLVMLPVTFLSVDSSRQKTCGSVVNNFTEMND